MTARVLVVDDEPQILRALRTSLRGAGLRGRHRRDGRGGARGARRCDPPDAVVLDLVLPDGSGDRGRRELRSVEQRADHRPLGRRRRAREGRSARRRRRRLRDEAVRRSTSCSRACARRCAGRTPAPSPCVEVGELGSTSRSGRCAVGGEPVQLTPHEFALLRVLARNAGKLLTHRKLLRRSGGRATATSRTTSTSTSRSCGASSSPIRRGRATSSRSPAPATGSRRRLEHFLRPAAES